jgi:hypothetical protein
MIALGILFIWLSRHEKKPQNRRGFFFVGLFMLVLALSGYLFFGLSLVATL